MTPTKIKIEAECPICKKKSPVEIPKEVISNATSKIITVHIDSSILCEHNFLIFLDSTKIKIIGYQKLDVLANTDNFNKNKKILVLADFLEEYGEDTVKNMIHATLLKIPIIVVHDTSEKINRAKLLNDFFQPVFPKILWNNYYPFFRLYDPRDMDKYGVIGLILNKKKNFSKITWIENTPLAIEEYLLTKAQEFLDSESQTVIIETELKKLEPIIQFIKKQIENWGSISGEEIKSKLDIFGDNIQKNDFLMELLQILKYNDYTDISKILVNKRNRKVLHFYHDLLERPIFGSNYENKDDSESIEEKNSITRLINEYGIETLKKILHAVLLKLSVIIMHEPSERTDRANILNRMFQPILPKSVYGDYLPFIRVFDPKDLEELEESGVVLNEKKKFKNVPWNEPSYILEDYLLKKVQDILDIQSQKEILKLELENLFQISTQIKRKMKNWSSISDMEIMEKFTIFDDRSHKEDLLMEHLQILKYTNFMSIDKILINKKNKKIYKFYHKLLKKQI